MHFAEYEKSSERGIAHVKSFYQGNTSALHERSIYYLTHGIGSRSGCLSEVSRYCRGQSMLAFFPDLDLASAKQWASTAAKTRILLAHVQPFEDYLVEELLWPLISDNDEVIDWYCQHQLPYELGNKVSGGDKDDPKHWMFYRYQSWLALNARWDELGERCERILAMQDEIKKDRIYLIDHRFYLALAKGDKAGMEAVLLEKTAPAQRKRRYEQESGLTRDFVDSYAVVFAKLAWRNGYQVEVDTPWIPKNWLPVNPLPKYEDPWPFMRDFDIWQPFEGAWAYSSPRRL